MSTFTKLIPTVAAMPMDERQAYVSELFLSSRFGKMTDLAGLWKIADLAGLVDSIPHKRWFKESSAPLSFEELPDELDMIRFHAWLELLYIHKPEPIPPIPKDYRDRNGRIRYAAACKKRTEDIAKARDRYRVLVQEKNASVITQEVTPELVNRLKPLLKTPAVYDHPSDCLWQHGSLVVNSAEDALLLIGQVLSLDLLNELFQCGAFLAGGLCTLALTTTNPQDWCTDCDLFIPSDSPTDGLERLTAAIDILKRYGAVMTVFGSVIGAYIRGMIPIQIISCAKTDLAGILHRFDMSCVKIGYDGSRFEATPTGLIALATGVTVPTFFHQSRVQLTRFAKVALRGWDIAQCETLTNAGYEQWMPNSKSMNEVRQKQLIPSIMPQVDNPTRFAAIVFNLKRRNPCDDPASRVIVGADFNITDYVDDHSDIDMRQVKCEGRYDAKITENGRHIRISFDARVIRVEKQQRYQDYNITVMPELSDDIKLIRDIAAHVNAEFKSADGSHTAIINRWQLEKHEAIGELGTPPKLIYDQTRIWVGLNELTPGTRIRVSYSLYRSEGVLKLKVMRIVKLGSGSSDGSGSSSGTGTC